MFLLKYLIKKIPRMVLVLLGVTLFTFIISHMIPGDPARMLVGQRASEETLLRMRAEMGLDQPVYIQYVQYMKALFQGDLGLSIRTQQPVLEELKTFFPATLELTLVSMFLTLVIGIPLGVLAALKRDKIADHLSRIIALLGVSTPLFWSGLMVLLVFYKYLNWFPASGRIDVFLAPPPEVTGMYLLDSLLTGDNRLFFNALHHMILPAACLAYIQLAIIARQVRSSMLEVLEQDYIRTAKANGLPRYKIIFQYALKNALLPTVTVAGLIFGELLGGAIITETVFAWPGMGKYVVDSVSFLDFPAIMGFTLIVAFCYVIINLLVDLLYKILDPQIREVN
ncbi:ABC transporter permease [Desulforamulus ruminis]|uniref:Binding-protein-dependent transport systems inner membrane component n=1 Tax=Desulforamulus ruminis (strain ATCC 23193 / DSM 2154 / NCIMB 8452 / DL) TaxID=696281 RepID=F6DKW7_DESRL|nr:ABC transporter permease [Desulforamulus ruminis]AEG61599.1 binding-protein-dependent transport systems inner membrane component [Desulforamulus ruminis DSM 2154]